MNKEEFLKEFVPIDCRDDARQKLEVIGEKQKLSSFLADRIKIYNDGKEPIIMATDIYDLLNEFEEKKQIGGK